MLNFQQRIPLYSTPDSDGIHTVLLALVLLGTTGVKEPLIIQTDEGLSKQELMLSMQRLDVQLTQPQHRNPPIGCESSTGPLYKEVVITNSVAAFPVFEVKYQIINKLPNPYQTDSESRKAGSIKEYLQQLQKVPHLLRQDSEGELDILEDAQLLPMGIFPVTRKGAQKLKEDIINGA